MAPTFRRILGRALRRRCPACGDGRIFASFLRLRRTCDACGWIVEREPGAVTGAMYLISILTQLFAAALFFVVWLGTDWSPGVKLAVACPVIVLFSWLALPIARSVWVAVDYFTDVAAGETRNERYARDAFEGPRNPTE